MILTHPSIVIPGTPDPWTVPLYDDPFSDEDLTPEEYALKHADRHAEENALWAERYAAGRCVECGGPLEANGCDFCAKLEEASEILAGNGKRYD